MAAIKIESKDFFWLSIPTLYLISMRWGMSQSSMFSIILAFIVGLVFTILLVWAKKTYFNNKRNNLVTNWFIYLALGLITMVVWMLGFLAGNSIKSENFNSCVSDGEKVRAALQSYYQAHQTYPESLHLLDGELPCGISKNSRFPSVLTYKHTQNTYELYFGDKFVSHTATELKPFEAHK